MEESNISQRVKFEYNLSNDEQIMGLKEIQRKYMFKRNIINTVLLLIIIGLYLQQVIIKPDYTMGWSLITICFALISFIWYNPVRLRKKVLNYIKGYEKYTYEFELYDEYFINKVTFDENEEEITSISQMEEMQEQNVEKENTESKVYFSKMPVCVIETKEIFLITIQKETNFVLPKRCISNAQQEEMRTVFSEKIGEDFVIKK